MAPNSFAMATALPVDPDQSAGEQTADDDPAGPTSMEAIADNLVSDRCSEGPCEIADRIEGRSPQRLQVSDFGSI